MWYHPGGIANILFLYTFQNKYKAAKECSLKNWFTVFKADSTDQVFCMASKRGLFFSDVKNDMLHSLINTVDKIK